MSHFFKFIYCACLKFLFSSLIFFVIIWPNVSINTILFTVYMCWYIFIKMLILIQC
jgi:hypothetical protein